MSDHKTALVPIGATCYSAPEQLDTGRAVDLGTFAEALVYYDQVVVCPDNSQQFASFVQWFVAQDALSDLICLLDDGTLRIFYHAFDIGLIQPVGSDIYQIWNYQTKKQEEGSSFESVFLYSAALESVVCRTRDRVRLYRVLRKKGVVTEVKAAGYGRAVENARDDLGNNRRHKLTVQAIADELYRVRGNNRAPEFEVSVVSPAPGLYTISWRPSLEVLQGVAGPKLEFDKLMPLKANAYSNRLIWSAALESFDLYVPRPLSRLIGDKLYESAETTAKAGDVIEDLKAEVEFPDVRYHVNSGHLSLVDVLALRRKAKRFRDWLQQETQRDRNAIIAYHNEVGREVGSVQYSRKALRMFGVIGSPAVGALVGGLFSPGDNTLGAVAGGAIGYLADVASKLGTDWRPVVFGDWARRRIEDHLKQQRPRD